MGALQNQRTLLNEMTARESEPFAKAPDMQVLHRSVCYDSPFSEPYKIPRNTFGACRCTY